MNTKIVTNFLSYLGNTNWHRVAVLLFIGCLGVGFGVGFSVAMDDAKAASDADAARLQEIFSAWQMTVTSHFARAGSLAASVSSFVMGSSDLVPMNYSAPTASRVVIINSQGFNNMCRDQFTQVPGILALQLQSGGVISQSYPPGSATIGLDVLYQYGQLADEGQPVTVGPAPLAQGGVGVFVRYPVYTNDSKGRATFWGTGNVIMRLTDVLAALNISDLSEHGVDYACWYVSASSNNAPTVVTYSSGADVDRVMRDGLRMQLPIAEVGKTSYLALYPRAGPLPSTMKTGTVLGVALGVLFGSAAVALLLYAALFAVFLHRHRLAPRGDQPVFMAALTLRGAQPVAENEPMEAVRMFGEFAAAVTAASARHQCYTVCEVGDRCVYVVSSQPGRVMALCQDVVANVALAPKPSTLPQINASPKARTDRTKGNGDDTLEGSITSA